MKAIQKSSGSINFCTVPQPELKDNEVLIKVAIAGICRTDIAVMKGGLGGDVIVPGHEFSGHVEIGNEEFKRGDAVAVNPIQHCQKCEQCQSGLEQLCQFSKMLGFDQDGAFAEYVAVREDLVYKLPVNVSLQTAAFIEPIAANLAVFNVDLKRSEYGGILGENRIANLMMKLMRYKGFDNVDWPVSNFKKYDFLIETSADNKTIEFAIEHLKPRGRLIIKSRSFVPTGMVFSKLIAKEIQCIAVNYGSYEEAISLLSEGLEIEGVFGKTYSFEKYEEAIEDAVSQEVKKVFLCAEL